MILELTSALSLTVDSQDFMRSLDAFEELLWLMDKRSPLHATLIAHVDGSTTVEQWEAALEQTRQRHPLWSARISEGNEGYPLFESTHDATIPLKVVEGSFSSYWEQEVAWELSRPIDTVSGPMVRAVLLHSQESCMLILVAHHSICDGMSLAFAIRDVLQALSGCELTNLAVPPSQEHALGMGRQAEARGKRPLVHSLQPTPDVSAYRTGSSTIPAVCSHEFSGTFTEILRDRARRERTSVHAALIAAAGLAARRSLDYGAERELHICSPINNRRLAGSPEGSGVFFTACDSAIPVYYSGNLWNLARSAKDALSPMRTIEGAQAVLSAVSEVVHLDLDAAAAAEEGGKLFRFDVMLTNLGALPIEASYGTLTLRQLWGPGVLVGLEGEQTLGVSTFNGRLSILHTSHSPLPNFLQTIEDMLYQACTS